MSHSARPEVLAFLSDVKDNPDDPTPWLVLTDWLEEHGDEVDIARAEYCRVCLDRLQPKVTAADWEKGERRRDLFRRHGKEWLGPDLLCLSPRMERGLVTIRADAHLFPSLLTQRAADPERWAWVGGLDGGTPIGQLVHPNHACLVEQLCLLTLSWGSLSADKVELLANCPALARLTDLSLTVPSWDKRIIRVLAESPCLVRVRRLRLSGPYEAPPAKRKESARRLLAERFPHVILS